MATMVLQSVMDEREACSILVRDYSWFSRNMETKGYAMTDEMFEKYDKLIKEVLPSKDDVWIVNAQVNEMLIELERYKDALIKISSRVVKDGDYEGAYWDMILEADEALCDDGSDAEEYTREDYLKNAHLPCGRYARTDQTTIQAARKLAEEDD